MHVGCKYKVGDVIKGLEIISEPYKVPGRRDYRAMVRCIFCGKEYETVLSEIHRHVFDGCGCQRNKSTSKKWKSFDEWCVENSHEYLLDLWDYELNNKNPAQVSCCSVSRYYFRCPNGKHKSSLYQICSITAHGKKAKPVCRYCNSFAQYVINQFGENALDLYWDYEKNTVDPWEISYNSKTQIWIKCIKTDYHDSYNTTPTVFFKVNGKCPYCYHRRIHPKDSFAYYYTQKYGDDFLDLYWDYEKNTVNPWKIAPQSNIYIYLKCDLHGSYRVYASNFYKHGTLCAECSRERDKSKLQEKVEKYIESIYHLNIVHEHSCSIIARSPKTNRWLPYDNDVAIDNERHLIIEVMGEQHYNANAGWIRKSAEKSNMTKEELLAEIQWRDEYKKQYALSQGYFYLAIPYWMEQDESYKTLIDEKIQSILTIQN
ncbi:MAG: zinc-ribbon domain-containing protein [Candidatus Kurthia intestinigallinarum]